MPPTAERFDPRPRYAGGCMQPVLLRGRVDHIDGATGELLHRYTTVHEPGGLLPVACKTRRASRCLPCAEVYRADTYQLIRAGLTGGKGVPDTVAAHPCVFVTLTAPSFGAVHTRRERNGRELACRPRRGGRACPHGRRMSCTERHTRDDSRLGEPLCPDCYDYTGSVLFNAYAPELWRRFTITLRRTLARHAGMTNKALADQLRISFAKVAEYQRRGVVHFHAIIRLDGPAGPVTPPPAWATLGMLSDAIGQAADSIHVDTPTTTGLSSRTLAWGREHDTRPITTTGELTDSKVAGYVAKYATKAAECTGTLDRRITPADRLANLPIRDHARRLIRECLRLGQLPELDDLRLTAWAHMLGFRGHFSTKSRHYSTTLGALRAARTDHQRQHAIATGLLPGPVADTTLVLAHWYFAGRGHLPLTALPSATNRARAPSAPQTTGGPPCPGSS
ncbi:MAG TPA: replication initiator [Streptosporangiaceae bacterium]|nr:replication initiator [Streptosporangiaceae bacterium]